MKTTTGLTVRPSSKEDKIEIEKLFEREGFFADFNEEFNEFSLPEDNCDSLENELGMLFNRNGISASFSTY